MSDASSRTNFMRREGFFLYTDVNAQVVNRMEEEPIGEPIAFSRFLLEQGFGADGTNEANLALHAVVGQMAKSRMLAQSDFRFKREFGVTSSEANVALNKGVFEGGFSDREFPWHFSAAVASSAVHAFVTDGHITKKQSARLTLRDWSGLIASPPFGRLMHSLAFTANGVYGEFGSHLHDHRPGALQHKIEGSSSQRLSPLFDTGYVFEAKNSTWYLAARLQPGPREVLRQQMQSADSTGCPVARRSARIPASFLRRRHVVSLIKNGILKPTAEQDGKVFQVEQEETAIDRTLLLIARRLELYDKQHGTPVIKRVGHFSMVDTRHSRRRPLDILSRTSEPPTYRMLALKKTVSRQNP